MTISVPFGRIHEEVAKLTEDKKTRAAISHGLRLGENSTIKVWPDRKSMAKTIRREEKSSPTSRWKPIVKLGDGEGY